MGRIALALIAATALTGAALAADDSQQTPTRAPEFASVSKDAVLSYNLIGLNVTDGQRNNVGEIKDIVIESGKLSGYILSVGGFLGLGERYVAVKSDSVSLGYDTDGKKWKAIVGASKDQLKAAPEFKYEGKFDRK